MSSLYKDTLRKCYVDPPNLLSVSHDIDECKDPEEALEIITKIYPRWIVHVTDRYSSDYPHLTSNWKRIAAAVSTTPKKIVLVEFLDFNETRKYSLLIHIAEKMTREGYCVRRVGEIVACEKCGAALPSYPVWQKMKENKIPIPDIWLPHCSGCS